MFNCISLPAFGGIWYVMHFKSLFATLNIFYSFFLGLYIDTTSPFLVQLASKLGYNKNQYAVIIDAGSTGSRVLAYKFDRSFIGM